VKPSDKNAPSCKEVETLKALGVDPEMIPLSKLEAKENKKRERGTHFVPDSAPRMRPRRSKMIYEMGPSDHGRTNGRAECVSGTERRNGFPARGERHAARGTAADRHDEQLERHAEPDRLHQGGAVPLGGESGGYGAPGSGCRRRGARPSTASRYIFSARSSMFLG
jgi:hypothetical protein